jgi:ATP-dependent Clp protease protease subunit
MRIDNTPHDSVTLVELNLLSKGVHFLVGEISEENITKTIQWLVYENIKETDNKVLTLYINSQGGSLYDALALIDIMNNSLKPIRTIGIGSIMSSAFLIFASGTKGHRVISENCGIMCHQFSDHVDSLKYHDLKAGIKEADNCNLRMLNVLKTASGLSASAIKSKLLNSSDVYLTPYELMSLNIADAILEKND